MPHSTSPHSTSLDQYEVWFLTGSQHLYGEDVLKQVAAQSRDIADALNANVPVKLVWKPVLTDSDAIRRTALEANSDDSVIGVTAWMHTFSPAKMWIQGLDALRKPPGRCDPVDSTHLRPSHHPLGSIHCTVREEGTSSVDRTSRRLLSVCEFVRIESSLACAGVHSSPGSVRRTRVSSRRYANSSSLRGWR